VRETLGTGRGANGFLFVAARAPALDPLVYFRSTSARDIPVNAGSRGASGSTPPLFFLLKSLICIGLVLFALGWPNVDAPPVPHSRMTAAAPQPPRRPQVQDHAQDLAQAGADALMAAARDKCLAAPRDCAALLQSLAGGKTERP
jgi:hypothetical protein